VAEQVDRVAAQPEGARWKALSLRLYCCSTRRRSRFVRVDLLALPQAEMVIA